MIKFILCSNNIVDNNYSNTEIKIKDAAKSLFLKKGYSATTTRDIARESDINLAMLNYYFRSKRRLFEIIMFETLYEFLSKMVEVYNDEKTSLEQKLKLCSEKYIDCLLYTSPSPRDVEESRMPSSA